MDTFKHTVPTSGAGQATHEQCWLASFGMIYKFYNLPVSSIEAKLSAAGIDVADAKANGLSDKDYAKAGQALGLTLFSGGQFNAKMGFFDMGDSDGCEAFVKELKQGPLWVSRYTGSGYHAVVAVGYTNPSWSEEGYIVFNNPYPGPTNALEDNTVRGNMFVKFITNARGSVMAYRS